jgi:hypothetical protein
VAGVYVIRDAATGKMVPGYASDLGDRLAQYTSRSGHPEGTPEARNNPINSNIGRLANQYEKNLMEFIY